MSDLATQLILDFHLSPDRSAAIMSSTSALDTELDGWHCSRALAFADKSHSRRKPAACAKQAEKSPRFGMHRQLSFRQPSPRARPRFSSCYTARSSSFSQHRIPGQVALSLQTGGLREAG
jgi:hypothetical protein